MDTKKSSGTTILAGFGKSRPKDFSIESNTDSSLPHRISIPNSKNILPLKRLHFSEAGSGTTPSSPDMAFGDYEVLSTYRTYNWDLVFVPRDVPFAEWFSSHMATISQIG